MYVNEIGGEFEKSVNENSCQNISEMFDDDFRLLLSGRASLEFIINDILTHRKILSVLMPEYCCESMIKPFIDNGIKTFFYKTDLSRNMCIDLEVYPRVDVVFIMEYFGFTQNIEIINKQEELIIEDRTHSFFQYNKKNYGNDYEMVSLRKWGPISTAVAVKKKSRFKYDDILEKAEEYLEYMDKARVLKYLYVNGNEKIEKKQFLEIFKNASEVLEKLHMNVSAESEFLPFFKNELVDKRRNNARYLMEHIKEFAEELLYFDDLNISDVPLFVPIKVPKECRGEIHNFMITNKIYLPMHWPKSKFHNSDSEIFDEEISLVCDQRYDTDDMNRMLELIKEVVIQNDR